MRCIILLTIFHFSSLVYSQGSGNALRNFNNQNYVNLGPSFNGVTFPITYSSWIYFSPQIGEPINTLFSSDNSFSGYHGFYVQINNQNTLFITFGFGNGCYTPNCRRSHGAVFPTSLYNTWVHIGFVATAVNQVSIYINGVEAPISTSSGSGNIMVNSNNGFGRIGNYTQANAVTPWVGKVDDIRIWSRALTVNEMRDNMCSKADLSDNTLKYYYLMDELFSSNQVINEGNHSTGNGVFVAGVIRELSGANIGDESAWQYPFQPTNPLYINDSLGGRLEINSTSFPSTSSPQGYQIYKVNEQPTILTGLGDTSCFLGNYFGFYPASNSQVIFQNGNNTLRYNPMGISMHPSVFKRKQNDSIWIVQNSLNYLSGGIVEWNSNQSQEYYIKLHPIDSFYFDTLVCDFPLNLGVPSNPNYTYIWLHNSNINSQISVNDTGRFVLHEIPNPSSCLPKIIYTYDVFSNLNGGGSTTTIIEDNMCMPAILSVSTNGYQSVLWNTSSVDTFINITSGGIYSAYLNYVDACLSYTDTVIFIIQEIVEVDENNLFIDTLYTCKFPKMLSISDFSSRIIEWDDGSAFANRTVFQEGFFYAIRYLDSLECISIIDTFKFYVIEGNLIDGKFVGCDFVDIIYIPNIFTPNGDGKNDLFKISAQNIGDDFNLLIFNRWGQIVHESFDIDVGWDGTFNNKEVPQGIYPALLRYTTLRGEKMLKRFEIHLFR